MARTNKRRSRREEGGASGDMTPMIDVVFLLIIFFLCIDFRMLEAKLPAYLPKDRGSLRDPAEPLEQLRLQIVCDRVGEKQARPGRDSHRLVGHAVHYVLGPKTVDTLEELRAELAVRAEPQNAVPDPTRPGSRKKPPVVVEPGPGAVYGDVAPCVDAIAAAGFTEILFGGGRGRR